jgi:hypothetical protein
MIEPAAALIAAIFGGVGLKIVESLLSRSKVKNDLQEQMRLELRTDVVSLREELDRIEVSLDQWKKKYYSLLLSFNELVVLAKSGVSNDEIDAVVDRLRSEGFV